MLITLITVINYNALCSMFAVMSHESSTNCRVRKKGESLYTCWGYLDM